jgi:hypothetical protein
VNGTHIDDGSAEAMRFSLRPLRTCFANFAVKSFLGDLRGRSPRSLRFKIDPLAIHNGC